MLAFAPQFLAPIIAALFGLTLAVTVFSIARRREAVRKKAMQTLAEATGATFSEKDAYGLVRQLTEFDLFKRERKRFFRNGRITNVMRSTVGETEVFLFDYTYVVSTGKSAHRVSQTVFFANDKKWFLPNFRLRPENWWHKMMTALGMEKDINFEENSDFSKKFWLKSEFEDLVRKQFTPDMQQFMLEKPPVHLEGNNYYLIAYKPKNQLAPDEVLPFFENCCALVKTMQSEGKMEELLELAEIKKEKVAVER